MVRENFFSAKAVEISAEVALMMTMSDV